MGVDKGQNSGNDRLRLRAMVDERRARVASYKVRGYSLRQTAAALSADGHVNPKNEKPWSVAILGRDLQFLDALWKQEALRDIGEHKARELEKIDQVERAAWEAWRRGIGKKQQTYTEKKSGGKGGGKASVRTEELNGDPRFLAIVLDCQKQRRALLGLDAPTKGELSGPGGTPLVPAVTVTFVRPTAT